MTFQSQQPKDLGNLSDIFSDPTRLFPDNVLLHFTDPVPDEFFAIHSGKAVIDIKPNDPTSGAPEVFLTINVPSCPLGQACNVALGTTKNAFDDDFVRFADYRGIPPQIIKAQVAQESAFKFDPNTYRYEPLTLDFGLVSPDTVFIAKFPAFSGYVLGPSPVCPLDFQLPQSTGLNNGSPDVTPRENFQIEISRSTGQPLCSVSLATPLPNTRKITSQDVGITMENILFTNNRCDAVVPCVSQNWTTVSSRRLTLFETFRLIGGQPFAAQTAIASSYGLLQVTYITAIDQLEYKSRGLGLHPSGLFDKDTSLDLGTEYLAGNFPSSSDTFRDKADLFTNFGVSLDLYNKGPAADVDPNNLNPKYALRVVGFANSLFSPR